MSTPRKVGSIARLFPDRVFGFIHCPEDARDYFFHQAQLVNCTFGKLQPGDVVSFVLGDSPKEGKIEAQEIELDRHQPVTGTEPPPNFKRPRRTARKG